MCEIILIIVLILCIVGKCCMPLLKNVAQLLIHWIIVCDNGFVFAFSVYPINNSITCCVMNIVKNCLSIDQDMMDSTIYILVFILVLCTSIT